MQLISRTMGTVMALTLRWNDTKIRDIHDPVKISGIIILAFARESLRSSSSLI